MKITFITPHVGRKSSKEYVRTWQMEPLTIATLVGLTPPDVEIAYYDERVESINFDALTDLAAITVETYTAKRAYEIAAEYHKRGVKTLLGGYHVTLIPDEAQGYADSILVGYAEPLWEQVIWDAERGTLQHRYTQNKAQPYAYGMPRRDIFQGKPGLPLKDVPARHAIGIGLRFVLRVPVLERSPLGIPDYLLPERFGVPHEVTVGIPLPHLE